MNLFDTADEAMGNLADKVRSSSGLIWTLVITTIVIALAWLMFDLLKEIAMVLCVTGILMIICMAVGVFAAHMLGRDPYERRRFAHWALLIGFLWGVIPHTIMSFSLWGLKSEFHAVAIKSNGWSEDLMFIRDQRDLKLRKYHFRGVWGSWWGYRGPDATTAMVYVCLPYWPGD